MAESSAESISPEKSKYYSTKIGEYLGKYPSDFRSFVRERRAVGRGDSLLSARESTGYNFATSEQYPLMSSDSLIFYSVYAQRKDHLGAVLAKMEREKIIRERDITFGVKATKIFGDYEDAEPVVTEILMDDDTKERALESVESAIVFHPTSPKQAAEIGVFLLADAPKVPGGYVASDLRATATDELKDVLVAQNGLLKLAVANVYPYKLGNLIVLKRETSFKKNKGWQPATSLLHPDLFEYLAGPRYRVKP